MKRIVLALAVLAEVLPASAEPLDLGGGVSALEPNDVPASVLSLTDCDMGEGAMRRRFSGLLLFAIRCPGNNHNYTESFVAADDEAGSGAALIVFPPTPYSRGEPVTQLSNVRLFEDTATVGEIFVDDEHGANAPCRFETLFRLQGRSPRLIFHRHTVDCETGPNTRWTTLLDKRSPEERLEDWN